MNIPTQRACHVKEQPCKGTDTTAQNPHCATGSLPSKQSSPEDKANFGAANGAAEDGNLPPYYEHVATIQKRENRMKVCLNIGMTIGSVG